VLLIFWPGASEEARAFFKERLVIQSFPRPGYLIRNGQRKFQIFDGAEQIAYFCDPIQGKLKTAIIFTLEGLFALRAIAGVVIR